MNCPKCGAEVKEGSKFCKKCGTSLDSVKDNIIKNQNIVQTEKKSSKNILIIAIAVIICVAIVAGAFVLMSNNNHDESISNVSTDSQTQKSWKLVDTYSGSGSGSENHALPEGKLKIKMSAFPLKNYGTNLLLVTGPGSNGDGVSLDWNANSAVESKSTSFTCDSNGNDPLLIEFSELDNWKVEVYQYS